MISNRANRKGAAPANRAAWRRRRRAASVLMALALCASAPVGALAQAPASAPDATAAVPAAVASGASQRPGAGAPHNAPPATLGSSIRKSPGAALGGAPAPADSAAATSASALRRTGARRGRGARRPRAARLLPRHHDRERRAPAASYAEGGAARITITPRNQRRRRPIPRIAKPRKTTKTAKARSSPFSSLQFSGNNGPIDIKSDTLDLDYKGNVVTFRGHVHAAQADATLTSDTLQGELWTRTSTMSRRWSPTATCG